MEKNLELKKLIEEKIKECDYKIKRLNIHKIKKLSFIGAKWLAYVFAPVGLSLSFFPMLIIPAVMFGVGVSVLDFNFSPKTYLAKEAYNEINECLEFQKKEKSINLKKLKEESIIDN